MIGPLVWLGSDNQPADGVICAAVFGLAITAATANVPPILGVTCTGCGLVVDDRKSAAACSAGLAALWPVISNWVAYACGAEPNVTVIVETALLGWHVHNSIRRPTAPDWGA